jgi:hypothetical protein
MLGGSEENTKNLFSLYPFPDQDANLGPLESEAGVLTTHSTAMFIYCTAVHILHLTELYLPRSLKKGKGKVKISLLQAVEVPRVARGRGSHIT